MRKIFSRDSDVLCERFLQEFIRALETLDSADSNGSGKPIFIGLSWGRSLLDFYSGLVVAFPALSTDLRKKIRFCLLDERLVDSSSMESNSHLVRSVLLDPLLDRSLITQDQIFLPDLTVSDPCAAYSAMAGRIDIALVGVGEDGHVCSLFPHHPLLSDTHPGYVRITDSPKPPSERITVSPRMLQEAPNTFVFFMGETKRHAMEAFFDDTVSTFDCPAKLCIPKAETLWSPVGSSYDGLVILNDLEAGEEG